jgi:hypothetical protein
MLKIGHLHQMHDGDIDRLIEILTEEKLKRHFANSTYQNAPQMQKSVEDEVARDLKKADDDAPKPQRSASYKLLTPMEANAKTAKNATQGGHFSAILHLAPATLAGCGNMCPASTEGCRKACLNTAGRGGMINAETNTNTVQEARIRKTKQLHQQPDEFFKQLHGDITKVKKYAQLEGKKPVVRLNGTSDLAWESFRPAIWGGKNVFEAHPDVQFYDYTKRPDRVMRNQHPNYHLTFSQSESNQAMAKRLLQHGHNVAVVFGGGRELPKMYHGHPVVSGDEHDLRFLDPKGGHVIGLKAKGDAKSDTSGFVVWDHDANTRGEGPRDPGKNKYDRVMAAQQRKKAE